jgi:hypothetical protein
MTDFVKIIRFRDQGFDCKPYTSNAYHHVFEFIDTEIKDLSKISQPILKSMSHRPKKDDSNWSGCFCFLDELDPNLFDSALAMRKGEKINICLLPKDSTIWVRNCSHLGIDFPYFNEFKFSYLHEGKEYWSSESSRFDHLKWVRMNVDLALERTKLWKEKNNYLPEYMTEFYLMEHQLRDLQNAKIKDKLVCYYKYNFLPKLKKRTDK